MENLKLKLLLSSSLFLFTLILNRLQIYKKKRITKVIRLIVAS